MWIIDASVALRWFLKEEKHENAEVIKSQIVKSPEEFAVPELFTFEVFSVLFRLHPSPVQVFSEGLLSLLNLGVLRVPMSLSMTKQAGIYAAYGLSGYDACYAALAKELNGKWLTYDKKAFEKIKDEKIAINLWKKFPDRFN